MLAAETGTGRVVGAAPPTHGRALVNPGMGFVLHYYDNSLVQYGSRLAPSDPLDDFPGLSTVYFRLAWSYVEPEEGRFDWSIVDSPAQRWIARGKQIAFRFSASEGDPGVATPPWVRAAGAKGYCFEAGKGVVPERRACPGSPTSTTPSSSGSSTASWPPRRRATTADPNVAFVDVGSFGRLGRGPHVLRARSATTRPTTALRHIDLYRKHFKRTLGRRHRRLLPTTGAATAGVPRCARSSASPCATTASWSQSRPNAYKQRGHGAAVLADRPRHPGKRALRLLRDRGAWGDGSLYLRAVEDYHASYASIHWWPREFLAANRDLVDRMNLRLGYRLQLVEASWPEAVRPGEPWAFSAQWRNAGVAPCLPGGQVAVTLKDEHGGIAAVFVDPGLDVRTLPVGPPGEAAVVAREASLRLPALVTPGTYDLFVSVGSAIGTPTVALPHDGDDGRRRVRLGQVRVLPPGAHR